jgi:hypothetical protein
MPEQRPIMIYPEAGLRRMLQPLQCWYHHIGKRCKVIVDTFDYPEAFAMTTARPMLDNRELSPCYLYWKILVDVEKRGRERIEMLQGSHAA